MVIAISRFRLRNRSEKRVREDLLEHSRLMIERQPGFCGLDVLRDASDPSILLLLTGWNSEDGFQVWCAGDGRRRSHELIPRGLKPDPFTSVIVPERMRDAPGGPAGAGETQSLGLSQWIADSDVVVALLVSDDGVILACNRAAERVFSLGRASRSLPIIWDSLVSTDAVSLRGRLRDPDRWNQPKFLLNVTRPEKDPVTLEATLRPCFLAKSPDDPEPVSGAFLLLGAAEQRNLDNLYAELQTLTNELSVMNRELAGKNRELEYANRTIQELARTDSLSGLANRRTFDKVLLREMDRARRQHQDLTLIFADLDHFKSVNDTYGHVVGDQVLVAAASVFASQSRPYDLAARYGGEEFALLLPGASLAQGVSIAQRLRRNVAALDVPGCARKITISLGVATWMRGESAETFIGRADAALYRAKRAGRNRVRADRRRAAARTMP